jgi:hypothetical protein
MWRTKVAEKGNGKQNRKKEENVQLKKGVKVKCKLEKE